MNNNINNNIFQDDTVDKDGDGIADVHQISPTELVTRKTLLFLKVFFFFFKLF